MGDLGRERRITMMEELTQAPGVPGYEGAVADLMSEWLKDVATPSYDGLGSVMFELQGRSDGPRIMLAGHMDEVGFMVSRINPEGFLKFQTLGGWWDQVLLGHRVVVKSSNGDFVGIIGSKPPHILDSKERDKVVKIKDMFIDVGAKDEEDARDNMGIRVGDPIVPFSPFGRMGDGDLLVSKAWDDRVGCALIVDLFHRLSDGDFPGTLVGVGTTQEEIGLRGAHTSVEMVRPDVGVALEVSIAGDVPGGDKDKAGDELRKGPSLLVYDRSMVPNLPFRDLVMDLAEQSDIPLQASVMSGGATDAGKIHMHAGGVPSVVLGVPTRYIHAQAGLMALEDYEHTLDLLTQLIRELDAETVAGFTR